LFVAAFGKLCFVHFSVGRLRSAPAKPRRGQGFSRAGLVLSVLAALVGVYLFGSDVTAPAAWFVYLASLFLFIIAFVRSGSSPGAARPAFRTAARQILGWLPLFGLLMLAAVIRLWDLEQFPFGVWYDEAVNGLVARQILAEPGFRPVYVSGSQMPAHYNYLTALSFSLFGASAWGVRLVSAFFGVLAVLFGYLLFRRWFGATVGALAACVLAVMRYHLTFSRLGMNGVATPAFELAAFYFLDRALAGKRVSDFAWLGLTVGLGLGFYLSFRLFVIVLAVFLVALLVAASIKYGLQPTLRRYVRALSTHWIVAAIGLLVAVMPVAQLAASRPDLFLSRSNTVSIFVTRDEPHLGKALWSNTAKHLEMFNVRGDGNGRHNLPGAPMLDPVLGALLVLGIGYALWRWRDPPNALMLLMFIGMLLAGILSLDFEAPQSYRSIGVIPALVYFIVVPLAAAMHVTRRFFERKKPPAKWGVPSLVWRLRYFIGASTLIAIVAGIAALELNTFFVKQRNDASAWAAYSTPETLAARVIEERADTYDFVVASSYFDPPTTRFLAPPNAHVERWTVGDRLPLVRENPDRPVIMMFDPSLVSGYRDAQRLYPNAEFIEHRAPAGGQTVLYEVVLAPEVLRSSQGAVALYYAGDAPAGRATLEQSISGIAVDWSESQPLEEPFLAEFRSTLFAPEYGEYQFSLHGSLDARLWIDEYEATAGALILARGTHALRMELTGGRGTAEAWWQLPGAAEAEPLAARYLFLPPVSNSGLLGSYFATPDWSGPPAFTQIDPELAFYFHIIPLPRPYSVRWTGKLFAPVAGVYDFELKSVDGSTLILDGELAVDNPNGRTTVKESVELAQGWHDIRVDFSDRTSGTQIYLYWQPPGGARELVPSRYLSPPMGRYPLSP
jgi:4-amino-4-deoxy-L-arabinose transferase-like glycosyltransferase